MTDCVGSRVNREPARVGWSTGVIIKELEKEVMNHNQYTYRATLSLLLEVFIISSVKEYCYDYIKES